MKGYAIFYLCADVYLQCVTDILLKFLYAGGWYPPLPINQAYNYNPPVTIMTAPPFYTKGPCLGLLISVNFCDKFYS